MKTLAAGLCLLFASAPLVGAAAASDRPPPLTPGEIVELRGCVKPGVEFNCLVLESGGRVYDVTGLGVRADDYLHGKARVVDRVTTCMQGSPVTDYQPDSSPAKACAAPRRVRADGE
jgi:hypothetical protein